MEHLTQRDFSALLDFLRFNYEARDLREFRSYVVSAVPRVVYSEVTGYNEVNIRTQRNDSFIVPLEAVSFPDSDRIFDRHIHEHPLISRHARTNDRRVLKISDFLPDARFQQLGIYQDFFRRIGTKHQMAMALSVRNPVIVGVALNRNGPDYTERERLLLSLIRPHVTQAYENALLWTRIKEELRSANTALRQLSAVVIILRQDGSIVSVPRFARSLLDKYFVPKTRNADLPELLRNSIKQHLTGRGLHAAGPLCVDRDGERLTLRLVREGGRILLILDERMTTISSAALTSLGLSARETEVLTWVARGRTNLEIAEILGVSVRTVQKHLEHVFQKLGVESRTGAASRAWDVARTYPDGFDPAN